MKMSGVNVAYDSLISVAYSGCDGGLVVYVADDPGANAGMCEQDSRGFAVMADMPMLEPATVAEAYAADPICLRAVRKDQRPGFPAPGHRHCRLHSPKSRVEEPAPVSQAAALLIRDIQRYTKAGAVIAMNQHRDLISRLEQAGQIIG